MKRWLVRLVPAGLAAVVLVAGGCAAATSPGPISADLDEFSVTLGSQQGPAGQVMFAIRNAGTIVHQFVIVRTDLDAGALPVEGGVVPEEGLDVVGEVEDIGVGATTALTASVPAGHYVVLCNIEGHYAAGMRADFTTR